MKELFDHLYTNKITPNGWMTLCLYRENIMYPNYINHMTETIRLMHSGFLVEEKLPLGVNYKLTDKALHLIREAENIIVRTKNTKKKDIPFSDWEEKIRQYVSIFPTGMKGSTPMRSTPKQLYDRFKWFFAEYPEFSWEDVLKATELYMTTKMAEGGDAIKYMVSSKYFIKKDDKNRATTSLLADWCFAIENDDTGELTERGTTYFGSDVV